MSYNSKFMQSDKEVYEDKKLDDVIWAEGEMRQLDRLLKKGYIDYENYKEYREVLEQKLWELE